MKVQDSSASPLIQPRLCPHCHEPNEPLDGNCWACERTLDAVQVPHQRKVHRHLPASSEGGSSEVSKSRRDRGRTRMLAYAGGGAVLLIIATAATIRLASRESPPAGATAATRDPASTARSSVQRRESSETPAQAHQSASKRSDSPPTGPYEANQPVSLQKCATGSKILFSCMTTKGKQIELCDAGRTIDYSFGQPQGKAEIVLRVPRSQASTSQWKGVGRQMSYSVDVPNGNTTYSVFWAQDRFADNRPIEAGVNVIIDSKLVATVKCSGPEIIHNLEGVDLKTPI